MKKFLLTAAVCFFFTQKAEACASYDEDYEYFNLFAQEIIQNKYYEPFLLTYSSSFYGYDYYSGKSDKNIPDENIESWEKFFGGKLSYEETNALVKLIDIKHFNSLKKGETTHPLFQKLGKSFYTNNKEAMDYLIQAKYMEPYMRINYIANPDAYYYRDNNANVKNATDLNYEKTSAALVSLYKAAKNPEIKQRYAYQLVRFNHYTRHYEQAILDFKTYVEPLKLKNHIYYYALDQKAGAERGLGKLDEANWDFFQVFKNSKNKKESAYNSMFLAKEKDFQKILNQAKTTEDKNMAYFLLAYNSFSNPIPIMEKMIENDADSEILKVLTVRAINQMERSYLNVNHYCYDDKCETFRNKRLPFFVDEDYRESKDFAKDLQNTIIKAKNKKGSNEFWELSEAYIKFLNSDYAGSNAILAQIKTKDAMYLQEIEKFKMLNEIVSQPKMTTDFENQLMQKYSSVFNLTKENHYNDTNAFVMDILANRYFLEKQDAKSFLLNNRLSDLQYNPNSELVKKVEEFYDKPNKTAFEKYLTKKMEDITDPKSFFNVIYGDRAMRLADFAKAKSHYEKTKNYKGIPRMTYDYEVENGVRKYVTFKPEEYNGFVNISSLVFGHNVWESFQSKPEESMKAENTSAFSFIKSKMNKIELAEALIQLENIGKGKDDKARQANQLIGNLLYNTSVLGYYRELFVMDVNNENGPKFQFGNPAQSPFYVYYKNFTSTSFVEPDNFDLANNFYQKALNLSKDKETKARILFQMASAEQGKYYQWETAQNFTGKYEDKDYDAKQKLFNENLDKTKNEKYRTAFANLKKNYSDTKMYKDLQSSCLYFGYYSRK